MSKNTGIRIETVREINDSGERGHKVISIKALQIKNLPAHYLNKNKTAYLIWARKRTIEYEWKLILCTEENVKYSIVEGNFYTCEDMKTINDHIKAAGQHLADVNAQLRKERKSWHSKVTFIDGEEICNKITKKSIRPWEPWLKKSTDKTAGQPDEPTEQIYKITDGSWNLCSTKTNPIMKHLSGLALSTDNKYRIIDQGCDLPAYSPTYLKTSNRNNTIVQNIDTDQIVFTCIQFLCKI